METIQRIPHTTTRHSQAARLLIDYLWDIQVNQTIPYDDLSQVIGLDIRKRRDILYTALRYLRETQGYEFSPETGKGIVRLDEVSKIGKMYQRIRGAHKGARTTARIGKTVDLKELTIEEKRQHLAASVVAAALFSATSREQLKKIESHTEEAPKKIEVHLDDYRTIFTGL